MKSITEFEKNKIKYQLSYKKSHCSSIIEKKQKTKKEKENRKVEIKNDKFTTYCQLKFSLSIAWHQT